MLIRYCVWQHTSASEPSQCLDAVMFAYFVNGTVSLEEPLARSAAETDAEPSCAAPGRQQDFMRGRHGLRDLPRSGHRGYSGGDGCVRGDPWARQGGAGSHRRRGGRLGPTVAVARVPQKELETRRQGTKALLGCAGQGGQGYPGTQEEGQSRGRRGKRRATKLTRTPA